MFIRSIGHKLVKLGSQRWFVFRGKARAGVPTEPVLFVPQGSAAFITADGKTFYVKG
jgi:hypothetical protein